MPNEFPMMAGLVLVPSIEVYCGATIIATRYALTAAHCLMQKNISQSALFVGSNNYKTCEFDLKLVVPTKFKWKYDNLHYRYGSKVCCSVSAIKSNIASSVQCEERADTKWHCIGRNHWSHDFQRGCWADVFTL